MDTPMEDAVLSEEESRKVDVVVAAIRSDVLNTREHISVEQFWEKVQMTGTLDAAYAEDSKMHAWIFYRLMLLADQACEDGLQGPPLHRAVQLNCSARVVTWLLAISPSTAAVKNRDGHTALHLAAMHHSCPKVVHALLHVHHDAVFERGADGNLPFVLALVHGPKRSTILHTLLEANRSAVGERITQDLGPSMQSGTSALVIAIRMKCAASLIKMMVVACPISLMFVDTENMLPLHVALTCNASHAVIAIMLHSAVAGAQGALTSCNAQGRTPLELALYMKKPLPLVKELITATLLVMGPLHKHFYKNSLPTADFAHNYEGAYDANKSGMDFQQIEGRFEVMFDCYFASWDDGVEMQRTLINSKANFQLCVDSTVAVVSAAGERMHDKRASDMLFTCMHDEHFETYNAEVFPLLLAAFGKDTVMQNSASQSFISYAIMERVADKALEQLLHHCSDDQLRHLDPEGNTVMHKWAANGFVNFLMPADVVGDPGFHHQSSKPPLNTEFAMFATRSRPGIKHFRMLYKAWPEACDVRNAAGFTFFDFLAGSECTTDTLDEVLIAVPQAVHRINAMGDTALHLACTNVHVPYLVHAMRHEAMGASGDPEVFKQLKFVGSLNPMKALVVAWLVKQHPEAVRVQNHAGATPLHNAAKYNCDELTVHSLLEAWPGALATVDTGGNAPLHHALAWNGALFASRPKVLELMMARQTDMRMLNKDGCSFLRVSLPLSYAIGQTERDAGGFHPLTVMNTHASRPMRKVLFAALLQQHLACLDEKDHAGHTPLEHMRELLVESVGAPFFGTLLKHFQVMCATVVYQLSEFKEPTPEDLSQFRRLVRHTLTVRDAARETLVRFGEADRVAESALSKMAHDMQKHINYLDGVLRSRDLEETREARETAASAHEEDLLQQIEDDRKRAEAGTSDGKTSARKKLQNARKKEAKHKELELLRETEARDALERHICSQRIHDENVRRKNKKHSKQRAQKAGSAPPPEHVILELGQDAFERASNAAATRTAAAPLPVLVGLRSLAAESALSAAAGASAVPKNPTWHRHWECPDKPMDFNPYPTDSIEGLVADARATELQVDPLPEVMGAKTSAPAWAGDGAPTEWGSGENRVLAMRHAAELNAMRITHELELAMERLQHVAHNECVVCMERVKCMAMVPCGHVALCTECAQTTMNTTKECPTCRGTITAVLRVFDL